MNIDKILSSEAFKSFDEKQKAAYISLIEKIDGKGPKEAMPSILVFMASMPKGKQFSQAEQNTMIEAIMENLSEDEKIKFNGILKILNSKNGFYS